MIEANEPQTIEPILGDLILIDLSYFEALTEFLVLLIRLKLFWRKLKFLRPTKPAEIWIPWN